MRKAILLGVLISTMLVSCTKTNNSAGTTWAGTYTGAAGGSANINRVVISPVGTTQLQMLLQINYAGAYYTYATLQTVAINTTTSATIDETGLIAAHPGTYHFTGNAALSGNNLTISGQASRIDSPGTLLYYFSGSK